MISNSFSSDRYSKTSEMLEVSSHFTSAVLFNFFQKCKVFFEKCAIFWEISHEHLGNLRNSEECLHLKNFFKVCYNSCRFYFLIPYYIVKTKHYFKMGRGNMCVSLVFNNKRWCLCKLVLKTGLIW